MSGKNLQISGRTFLGAHFKANPTKKGKWIWMFEGKGQSLIYPLRMMEKLIDKSNTLIVLVCDELR